MLIVSRRDPESNRLGGVTQVEGRTAPNAPLGGLPVECRRPALAPTFTSEPTSSARQAGTQPPKGASLD